MSNDPSAIIETERTFLRPFEEADAGIGFTWFFDPEVMRFIPSGPDHTLDDSRRRISGYLAHQAKHGFSKRLIFHRETGEPIGDAGLLYLPDGQRIELGFRLARPYWGQGYAMEVAHGWLAWFDDHLPGQSLFADVHPEHTRSQRVLEKLGFQRTEESIIVSGMTMQIYRHAER
jgi:RimJ/RimL family protein N-acetyltransferase